MYDEEVEQFSRCIVVVSPSGRYTDALRVDCPRVLRPDVAIFSPIPHWAPMYARLKRSVRRYRS